MNKFIETKIELQNEFVKMFPLEDTDFSEQYQEIFAWCNSKIDKSIKHQQEQININIGMLRQWLNEDRIDEPNKMVTNEDIKHWLKFGLTEESKKSE